MSWQGRYGKGAARERREQKRLEAEERDRHTLPERRSNKRGGRLVSEIFTEPSPQTDV